MLVNGVGDADDHLWMLAADIKRINSLSPRVTEDLKKPSSGR